MIQAIAADGLTAAAAGIILCGLAIGGLYWGAPRELQLVIAVVGVGAGAASNNESVHMPVVAVVRVHCMRCRNWRPPWRVPESRGLAAGARAVRAAPLWAWDAHATRLGEGEGGIG